MSTLLHDCCPLLLHKSPDFLGKAIISLLASLYYIVIVIEKFMFESAKPSIRFEHLILVFEYTLTSTVLIFSLWICGIHMAFIDFQFYII